MAQSSWNKGASNVANKFIICIDDSAGVFSVINKNKTKLGKAIQAQFASSLKTIQALKKKVQAEINDSKDRDPYYFTGEQCTNILKDARTAVFAFNKIKKNIEDTAKM